MRVVFVILDGMPPRHVRPDVTPQLLANAVGPGPVVGRSVMTSATYPNHATFATGCEPVDHGLLGNWIVSNGRPCPAQTVGPSRPTLFDACAAMHVPSMAVLGDHNLVGVMGAAAADSHWPPGGVFPDGVTRDAHDYAADPEIVARAVPALEAFGEGLAVVHLNEPDTAGHVHGPNSPEALANYTRTDAALGDVLDALRPGWASTVVVVVSDHDMQPVDPSRPIDLWAEVARQGLDLLPIPEGSGTIVWGDDPTGGRWLDEVDGVAGHGVVRDDARLVWAEPDRWFALPPGIDGGGDLGQHGGATTRDQVAAVSGGHSAAAALAAAISDRRPEAADWAPTLATLLALPLPSATGRSLI